MFMGTSVIPQGMYEGIDFTTIIVLTVIAIAIYFYKGIGGSYE